MNYFKTFMLLLGMAALLMGIGYLIGGMSGVIIALVIAVIINFASWYFSDTIILKMYKAKEVDESSAPNLYRMVTDLTNSAGMPMPKVYIIPSASPNAFATGRDPEHAAVAVTEGILGVLTYEELRGVVGHELAHVKNRDSLIMTIAATISAAIGFLAIIARYAMIFGGRSREGGGIISLIALLVIAILAPIVAMVIQLAISRTREYSADKGGAQFSGQPLALASALKKITSMANVQPQQDLSNPTTAHLWIASPIKGRGFMSLFSTHPPVEERIRRLEEIAANG